jgi:CubicO group peptidase (beta-lactamase class C family)
MCLIIGIQFVLLNSIFSQSSTEQRIDSILKFYNQSSSPGVAVAVVRNRSLMYKKGFGSANIAEAKTIDPSTSFWIASVTKQFTAAGIFLLMLDKKLDIENSVRKYLPNLPSIFDSVTVEELIHHTSGIRDGFVLTALSRKQEEEYTNENALAYLAKQKEFNFSPGTQFEYNNSGYVLLAMVIEKVSGNSYPSFMSAHVFKPLGMSATYVSGKIDGEIKIAKGYRSKDGSNKPGSFEVSQFKGNTYGSTGIITNVSDLANWAAVFHNNAANTKLGKAVKLMQKAGNLKNGSRIGYAGGLEMIKYNGEVVFEHFGADEGYKANIVFFPYRKLSVIGLANNSTNYDLSNNLYTIGNLFLNKAGDGQVLPLVAVTDWKQEVFGSVSADPTFQVNNLDEFEGTYFSTEIETSYKVILNNSELNFELVPGMNLPLRRINGNTFEFDYVGSNIIKFSREGFEFSREGVRYLKFTKVSH